MDFVSDWVPNVSMSDSKPREGSSEWINVATLAELFPGMIKVVSVESVELILQSQPEGCFAENSSGTRVALRLVSGGMVQVNLHQKWPDNRLLSHATGEPVNRVDSTENFKKHSTKQGENR